MTLITIDAQLDGGHIVSDLKYSELVRYVMDKNIVVLKSVFEEDDLLDLRSQVFTWGTLRPLRCYDRPMDTINDVNFHRVDNQPHLSRVPHLYHCFVFNFPYALDSPLQETALRFIEPLRLFYNTLTGNNSELSPHCKPEKIRPEFIQYPLGGGFFKRHKHDLNPQKIGLIMSLSRQGIDYNDGGTTFHVDDKVINTESYHEVGDITLFRYDLPHEVLAVDQHEELNWESDRGRWTMIMPYHA